MYPLDQLTNARRPVAMAGRTFPIRQLSLKEWGEVQAWLKSVVPNPVTTAITALSEASKAGPVPQPVQDALFRQAQEESRRWPPKAGTGAWFRALSDADGGQAMFIRHAVRLGGTELTEDEAEEIGERATSEEIGRLIVSCLYGEPDVPKAAGESTPPSPTTGDGSSSTSGSSSA